MVGWDVDGEAGFDTGFHAVLRGGVVGEEVDCGLAVLGREGVLGRGKGFGDRGGEEGEHGCVGLYERFGVWFVNEEVPQKKTNIGSGFGIVRES